MKILFLANRLPHQNVAGGHRLIHQRMQLLANKGHAVGLASFVSDDNAQYVQALSTTLHEVQTVPLKKQHLTVRIMRDYVSGSLPAIFWKNYSRRMMRLVGDMVDAGRYDVVIAAYSEMGMYLYRNPFLPAVHKVVSCHRCLTSSFAKYVETPGVPLSVRAKSASQLQVLEKYEFEMYSAMDHILTLTQEDRFTLLNYAPQLPVSVIRPGIDFNYFDRKRKEAVTQPVVMMCGFFADKSNHDAAMWFIEEIWPAVKQKYPKLKCIFAGKGASPEMERAAAAYPETMHVISTVEDLRPYREQATIFINPMRLGSGLRVKVLEAMATGLPVVTTALGVAGIPAQNGENCFVADTPDLFAQSIDWLMTDLNMANKMGTRGREMVKSQFNSHSSISELEQVLEEVISIQG
ncbi:glycosyltransferase [Pontiellaceae bacterium B12227]|nr:glycosyltransferase [Pontiellaceae bacterium B12227]